MEGPVSKEVSSLRITGTEGPNLILKKFYYVVSFLESFYKHTPSHSPLSSTQGSLMSFPNYFPEGLRQGTDAEIKRTRVTGKSESHHKEDDFCKKDGEWGVNGVREKEGEVQRRKGPEGLT